MFEQFEFNRQFFTALAQIDEKMVKQVAEGGCLVCGVGRLHRGDFERKPRGGLMAVAGEKLVMRFSLCCGRDGCRKRSTPPSLRFLGRRVYLGAVVIVASVVAQALAAKEIRKATGVPVQTTRRWLGWWRGAFIGSDVFVVLRARLIGIAEKELPASLVRRLGEAAEEQVRSLLEWLKPLTTGSGIGSRSTREIA